MRRAVRRPVVAEVTGSHELVGMQAALHQKLAPGFADQLDRFCCGRVTVWRVDQFIASDIDPMLLGDGGNFGYRPDQNGNDDPKFRRGNSAAQRGFVAGVGDNRGGRRHFSGK